TGAAARPARGDLAVARIQGTAEKIVFRKTRIEKCGHVGAADDDSAGRAQVRDHRSIIGCDQIAEGDDLTLIVTGTPCSGPSASPCARAASAAPPGPLRPCGARRRSAFRSLCKAVLMTKSFGVSYFANSLNFTMSVMRSGGTIMSCK